MSIELELRGGGTQGFKIDSKALRCFAALCHFNLHHDMSDLETAAAWSQTSLESLEGLGPRVVEDTNVETFIVRIELWI